MSKDWDKHGFVDCKEESEKVKKEEIVDESTERIKEEYVEYYEDVKNENSIGDTVKEESDKVNKEEEIKYKFKEEIKEEIVEYYEAELKNEDDYIDDTVDTDQKKKRIKTESDDQDTLCNEAAVCDDNANYVNETAESDQIIVDKAMKCPKCTFVYTKQKTFKLHDIIHNSKPPYVCSECDYKIGRTSIFNNHIRTHSKDQPFYCRICDVSFGSTQYVYRHIKSVHPDSVIHCDRCQYTSYYHSAMKRHKISDHLDIVKTTTLKCVQCPFIYTEADSLELHKLVHTSSPPYYCTRCDFNAPSAGGYNKHIFHHIKDQPFRCDFCNCSYNAKSSLHAHINRNHLESVIRCDECSYTAYNQQSIEYHKKSLHSKDENGMWLRCGECVKFIYTKPDSLQLHRIVHNTSPPYFCTKCKFDTADSQRFNFHILSHTNDKPYGCKWCKKYFRLPYTLKHHINNHHSDSNSNIIKYKCDECRYTTHDQDLFSKHKNRGHSRKVNWNSRLTLSDEHRNHSKIARFSKQKSKVHESKEGQRSRLTCDKCKFICTKEDSLDLHQIIHSTPKSNLYQCTKCDHETRLVGDFNHHILSHFDDNPYICTLCNASFTKFGSLKTHVQSVHPYSTIKLQHLYQ